MLSRRRIELFGQNARRSCLVRDLSQYRNGLPEICLVLCTCSVIFGEPERADEPCVADQLGGRPHISIVLETRHAAGDRQSLFDGLHRTRHKRVINGKAAEIENAEKGRVDRAIWLVLLLIVKMQRTQEPAKPRIV